jgi:hypothetical protein
VRRLIWVSVVGVFGCTEPNPNAVDSTGSEDGSGGDPTSAGTTPGTSMTSSPDTTVSGTDDPDTTIGTTVDPSDTTLDPTEPTTGEPTCAHQCVVLPPGDWEGPVAVLHDAPDDGEPACEGAFDVIATTVFANLDAAAASCACECEDPTGLSCSSVTVERHTSAGCASLEADWEFSAASCYATITGAAGKHWRAYASIDAGSCDAIETFSVPAAGFGDRYAACAQAELDTAGCSSGSACVQPPEAPFDGRICIWHSGDLQCPADGGYDVRNVYYESFADDRGCEACTCEDAEGACDGGVYLYNPANCSGTPAGQITVGTTCVNLPTLGVEGAQINAGNTIQPVAGAACDPSDSQAVGEAEGTDPVTFCCDS